MFTLAVSVATAAALFGAMGASNAAVTGVEGSAYGYQLNVSLFGGQQPQIGPVPTVTLPAGGSSVPVTASAATGSASAGPARFFSSGPITVSTVGTPAGGSVTSTADIMNTNTSGQESLTAADISSTCTASETGVSGSTTITGGTLQIDNGDDVDDPTAVPPRTIHPPVDVPLPVNPDPNTAIDGHIHVNGSQDNFRYVFNEQTVNADGSITVSAAHEKILGPTAVGDLYIGQVVCGVTAVADTTTSTTSTTVLTTTTTIPGSTTTTTRPPRGICAQLRQSRAAANAQIDAAETAVRMQFPAGAGRRAIIDQLEAARTQVNTAIAQALDQQGCGRP